MNIAVCDDDIYTCNLLEEYIDRWKGNIETNVDIFLTGKEFSGSLRRKFYDMTFLDIMLKDGSGMEIGRQMREEGYNRSSLLIFISNYSQYAKELFWYEPFRFLIKPVKEEYFRKVFYDACEKIDRDSKIFEFRSGRTIYRIPFRDIMYLEGDNRRVRITTEKEEFYSYSTVENMFSRVNTKQHDFLRIHKSHMVNINYIKAISARAITMQNGAVFSISDAFKKEAQKRFQEYLRRIGK